MKTETFQGENVFKYFLLETDSPPLDFLHSFWNSSFFYLLGLKGSPLGDAYIYEHGDGVRPCALWASCSGTIKLI